MTPSASPATYVELAPTQPFDVAALLKELAA
jgi:hypothetical protein